MTRAEAFQFVEQIEELIYCTQREITDQRRVNCVAALAESISRLTNGLPLDTSEDAPRADGAGC